MTVAWRVLADRGATRVVMLRDRAGHPLVLKHLATDDDCAAARLRAEAELLKAAGDSGVIALRGTIAEPPGIVLEYASGGSLADRLRISGALPPAEAVRIVAQLADALAHLHARGIVHRDVKPSNVLFTAHGELRLADFGVAARIGSCGTLGDGWEELRVGTPPYAAPEQWTAPATSAHPAADVYALGVVLYELLTARLPWEPLPDEDDEAFASRIRHEAPLAPSARGARLPPALEALVMGALRPIPEDRPASAAEFARRAREAMRSTMVIRALAAACIAAALLLARIFALPA
ncbi:MAG TPA: serine/threonine-protein kinase [Longimicrobium sp.]|jgi:serine/threonine-protein kinase